MKSTLTKEANGTILLTITIPADTIVKTYADVVKHMAKHVEVDGFRKGKVPKAVVEEKLDKTKVYEEVIRTVLPEAYAQAIKDQSVQPIVSPKIELKEAQEGKDWIILARTCEKPSVTLGDYKKAIQELKAGKRSDLWVPGKNIKPDEKKEESKPTLDDILSTFFHTVQTTIPELLIENDVNRMLSNLIDQTKKLGLTVDQYLASTNRTSDSIRAEYQKQAARMLTLEFGLELLAEKETITAQDKDIDAIINSAKTEEEKKNLQNERYYVAAMVRRQKTLDFLAHL